MASALALFCACALAVACVPIPCLHALYTEDDQVTDPYFAGKWVDEDQSVWKIEKRADKEYWLRISKDGEQEEMEFELHLVKLGSFLFLDARQKDPHDGCFLRPHLIGRVWIEKDEVRIALLDDDWVKEQIEARKLGLRHEMTDDGIVLTASTKELQEAAVLYAQDEKAFSVKTTLVRLYPEEAR
jgi:hypothetical protein